MARSWPPRSSYLLSSDDVIRHQLMSLWSAHHGNGYDFRIWTLPRDEGPTAKGVLLSLCLEENWGQRFAVLSETYKVSSPFLLISMPEGEESYHLLMLEEQNFRKPIRYFLFENALIAPAEREIVMCPKVCMYEHILLSVRDRNCLVKQKCELFGHTPRGPERLLPGQTLNLPTGTFRRLGLMQEARLCSGSETTTSDFLNTGREDFEALLLMQIGAAMQSSGPEVEARFSLQERDVSYFLDELRAGCTGAREEAQCVFHLVSGSEDIVREQVANVHLQDLDSPRAFVYCLLSFLPPSYAGSFRIWMFRATVVAGMHSLLAVHRDRPGQVPVYVQAVFSLEPTRKHIAFMHQPQPAVYFVGCFGWERMIQAGADRYSFQVDDVPVSSLSTVDMRLATLIRIRETAYCEFESGLPARRAYWDNLEAGEDESASDALSFLQWQSLNMHTRQSEPCSKKKRYGLSDSVLHSNSCSESACRYWGPLFHYDPWASLPPPGNPVWWLSRRLECLDVCMHIGKNVVVMDALPSQFTEQAAPRPISLFEASPIQDETSLAPVLCGANDKATILCLEQHLWPDAAASPQTRGYDIDFPSFQPLIDALFAKPRFPSDAPFDFGVLKHFIAEDVYMRCLQPVYMNGPIAWGRFMSIQMGPTKRTMMELRVGRLLR